MLQDRPQVCCSRASQRSTPLNACLDRSVLADEISDRAEVQQMAFLQS